MQFCYPFYVLFTFALWTPIAQYVRLRPLPELAMTRADYQDLCAHIPIFRPTVVILVSMYRPALFNESLLAHSSFQLLLATIRTSMPSQMARRLLQENGTALSALYPYWLMGIDIFHFRIVKPITMYLLCILDKLRCRFPMERHKLFCRKLFHVYFPKAPIIQLNYFDSWGVIITDTIQIICQSIFNRLE